jgi:hypothetical protein
MPCPQEFPSLFHLPIALLGAVSVPGLFVLKYYLTYNSKTNKTKNAKKRNQQEEVVHKQTGIKTNKQIPGSGTIEF